MKNIFAKNKNFGRFYISKMKRYVFVNHKSNRPENESILNDKTCYNFITHKKSVNTNQHDLKFKE